MNRPKTSSRAERPCPGAGGSSQSGPVRIPIISRPAPGFMSMQLTYEALAKRIDHSLLGPTLTVAELEEGCRLAAEYRVASVSIKPFAVARAATILEGSGVHLGTTVGFPHGANATPVKVFEADRAMADGATELDMVINIGRALEGDWNGVAGDIAVVTEAAHRGGAIVKVIFEN